MKVEIELADLESLKKQLSDSNALIEKLKYENSQFQKDKLVERAINLSYSFFEDYMKAVFKKLGFNYPVSSFMKSNERPAIKYSIDFDMLDEKWYQHGKLDIYLSAEITSQFKSAYLNMGVLAE